MSDAPQPTMAAGKDVTPNVRLIGRLGAGGMGAVWLAHHKSLHRQVVVKFMLGELDSSGPAKKRFEREAAAAAAVRSPHVVQMHDYGVTEDGVPFIVMEHLEGRDLGSLLKERGALDPPFVVEVVTQVGKALGRVHAAGLLHRDVKPDNIFLCDADEGEVFVKLLDFGIAKPAIGEGGTLDGETKTGQVVGTPFYMSPEQVTAQKSIDARADLWALGIVTFELLTGIRPFDGPSFGALAVKIATGDPLKATDIKPELGAGFDTWFAKACARDPKERFGTARAMTEAFREAFGVNTSGSGVNSDSGRRSGPRSAIEPARSGDPPAFGLASTINDGAGGESSLAKSAAATTSDTHPRHEPKKGPRNVLIAIGALSVAVVVAAVAMNRPEQPEPPTMKTAPSVSLATAASAPPPAAPPSDAVPTAETPSQAPAGVPDAAPKAQAPAIPVKPPVAPPPALPPAAASAKPPESPPVAPRPSSTLVSPW